MSVYSDFLEFLISFCIAEEKYILLNEKLLTLLFSLAEINESFVIVLNEVRITPLQSCFSVIKLSSCQFPVGMLMAFFMIFKADKLFV